MRITRIGYALGIAAAVAIAGCSSNGSSLGPIAQGPTGTQSVVRFHPAIALPGAVLRQIVPAHQYTGKNWASPDSTGTLDYVCTFYSGTCNWYKNGHNVVMGTIAASYPNGICVDRNQNVYIPNGGTGHILEYAKGGTTVLADFDNTSVGQPSACTVGNNGTLYVANISANSVSVYNVGSTTPSRMLQVHPPQNNPGITIGISIDEHNLLAVSWLEESPSFQGGVDEYVHAHGAGTTVALLPANDFGGGVAFDNAEDLILNDQSTLTSNVYHNGSPCASFSTTGDAVNAAPDRSNGDLLEGDATNTAAEEVTFAGCSAGGGTVEKVYNAGLPSGGVVIGVAVDPGPRP